VGLWADCAHVHSMDLWVRGVAEGAECECGPMLCPRDVCLQGVAGFGKRNLKQASATRLKLNRFFGMSAQLCECSGCETGKFY